MTPSEIDPALWWMAAALLLGIAELIVPGVFLIWLSAAAAAAGLATWAFDPPVSVQFILFAVFSALAVMGGRRYYLARPVASEDPFINERAVRMIGETVTATTDFTGGRGRVRLGDGEWAARGPDCTAGDAVRIMGMDGATLIVRPAALLDGPAG